MALIGKIRQNFWFVLIVLGFALAAFVIMDMTSANRGNTMNPTIGTINGTKINAQEFSSTESILSQNSQIQDANQRRENLWNYFVDKTIVEGETEELGLSVSYDELMDLQFGQNLSPIIQQSFFNPNTGQVDRQQLAQIQNAITTNTGLSEDFKAFWAVQENQVIADKLQNKLTNIVSKSVYTPTWMVEQEYKHENTRAQVAYVKVPFDAISNDAVEVNDSDIKDYMNKNKSQFTSKVETRVVDYITFPVLATSKDSAAIFADMADRTRQLETTTSDSIYAVNNGGDKPTLYYRLDDLPVQLKNNISDLEVGQAYGPYLDNGVYSSAKIVNKQVIPDSVEARIIVRQALSTNPAQVTEAQKYIDSLRTLLTRGVADFDSLAIANSQDPSTAQRGGDLGYITQGMLPSPLDDILFLEGNIEGLYETKTPQGIFLIQITDIIQRNTEEKYRLAYINVNVNPSQETQDSVLDVVNDFLSDNRSLESITSAANALNLNVRTSSSLDQNSFQIGTLGSNQSSRDVVRWAFDQSNEVGDVAPDFYSFTDPIDYYTDKYVVVGLRNIIPAGMSTVESVKDNLMPLVRNMKKGAKIKGEISGTDLSSIASKYSTRVDTLAAVTMGSSTIPALGNEPEVVAAIFKAGENNVSGPIVGNSGVYVVKPIAIAQPGAISNLGSVRNTTTLKNRSKVAQGLIDGLKKNASVDDGRFGYGF